MTSRSFIPHSKNAHVTKVAMFNIVNDNFVEVNSLNNLNPNFRNERNKQFDPLKSPSRARKIPEPV